MTNSSSISIRSHPQSCSEVGVYYVCGVCHRCTYVTIKHGEGGIELSGCDATCYPPKWSPHNLCSIVTRQGSVLISCGYCRSGKTVLEILPRADGTSYSQGNSDRRKGNSDRRKGNEILDGSGDCFGFLSETNWNQNRRGLDAGRRLKERLEFFNENLG